MYICDFSRSDGAGSATTRNTRGLTRSVMARIVPPLPAASRPSKTTITRSPLCFTHVLEPAQLGLQLAQCLLVLLLPLQLAVLRCAVPVVFALACGHRVSAPSLPARCQSRAILSHPLQAVDIRFAVGISDPLAGRTSRPVASPLEPDGHPDADSSRTARPRPSGIGKQRGRSSRSSPRPGTPVDQPSIQHSDRRLERTAWPAATLARATPRRHTRR